MNENYKCLYKKLEEKPSSSTFEDVRNHPEAPLYKCIECDGFNRCDDYTILNKFKNKNDYEEK